MSELLIFRINLKTMILSLGIPLLEMMVMDFNQYMSSNSLIIYESHTCNHTYMQVPINNLRREIAVLAMIQVSGQVNLSPQRQSPMYVHVHTPFDTIITLFVFNV